MRKIYLNNAATSWPKPEEVYTAMDQANRGLSSNPGRETTSAALSAARLVMDTRELLAELFHIADPLQIAFMSNVTEALNVALQGVLLSGDHLIISSMEHNSLARPAHVLAQQGIELTVVPCDAAGRLDPAQVARAFRNNTRLVGLLHASNVTGTIQPVAEVGRLCREAGVLFMLDAAQSAGVLPIDVEGQCVDLLAFTGHKGLMGPQGTGGLYVRPGLTVRPLKTGGTGSQSENLGQPSFMPDCLESGTINTPGIVGLGAGVRFILDQGLAAIRAHERQLTELLLTGLGAIPAVRIYGPADSGEQTAVISFNIGDMDSGQVGHLLETEFGIVARAGLHCAPLAHKTLGTFEQGACRLSPGYFSTDEDMAGAVAAVAAIAARL